ncbi:hypothetical protein AGMMS50212_13700 [Spirochaetia bacterium]|nr:hypothetical protein AGMMS50212_13700 [Spirochaetia bacterium]
MTKEEKAEERKNDRKIINETNRVKREIGREIKNMTIDEQMAYFNETVEWAKANNYGFKFIHHVSEA